MADPNGGLTSLWIDEGQQQQPQQVMVTTSGLPTIQASSIQVQPQIQQVRQIQQVGQPVRQFHVQQIQQTQQGQQGTAQTTIKLEDFLQLCKNAGLERPDGLVQQTVAGGQQMTRIIQKPAQPSPQITKIIAAPLQQHQATVSKPQTIQMEDILKAFKAQQAQTQSQPPQQMIQQTVVTGQPGAQKVIALQVPVSMAQQPRASSPSKSSPFKIEPQQQQQQAAFNATKLHSYSYASQSPILSAINRTNASTLVVSSASANSSPSSVQRSLLMNSPSQNPWQLHVTKRDMDLMDTSDFLESKRFRKEKGGKGLRHFSMKVCEKVQKKGVTSYNEVADELVAEFSDPRNMSPTDQNYDQKNIRRRVYDALNVLMAMNIISKEKKEIRWIGLPTNSQQECQTLEIEKARRLQRIQEKKQQLQELLLQQVAFKNIVLRNRNIQRTQGPPAANSAIHLPYIIVNTSKKTVIDCSISNDKYEYLFNFDNTFEIHDDIEVLKRMGMAYGLEKGQCSPADLHKAVKLVPKVFEPYIKDMAGGGAASVSSLLAQSRASTRGKNSGKFMQSLNVNNNKAPSPEPVVITEAEPSAVSSSSRAPSRQSSVGSFSDVAPSRANTDTSDLMSDDDEDDSDDDISD